jgi:hypothetical protein
LEVDLVVVAVKAVVDAAAGDVDDVVDVVDNNNLLDVMRKSAYCVDVTAFVNNKHTKAQTFAMLL